MRGISLLVAFTLATAGCGGGGGDEGGSGGAAGSAGTAGCDTFSAGMAKTTPAGTVVTLESATPAPPEKGYNTWMIGIADGAGAPVDGASLTVTPFMPEHGHGSPVTPSITPQGAGKYEIDKVNFMMPGVWETTIEVAPPGGKPESVMFGFCIEG